MTAPPWLPDWRDPAAYEHRPAAPPTTFRGAQWKVPDAPAPINWRWEFLRRSPAYQAVWDALPADAPTKRSTDMLTGRTITLRRADPASASSSIEWLADPADPWVPEGLLNRPPLTYLPRAGTYPDDLDQLRAMEADGYLVMAVDLRAPTNEVLDTVRKVLDEERRVHETVHAGRERSAMWPLYLRLLDADAVGASLQDVADTLSAGPGAKTYTERSLRDMLKPARALRDAAGPNRLTISTK